MSNVSWNTVNPSLSESREVQSMPDVAQSKFYRQWLVRRLERTIPTKAMSIVHRKCLQEIHISTTTVQDELD